MIAPARGIDLNLNHLDLDVVTRRVVGPDRAIDDAAVVELAVHVFQEIRAGDRRARDVHGHRDRAEVRLELDKDGRRRRLRQEKPKRQHS